VLFRAQSLDTAVGILRGLVQGRPLDGPFPVLPLSIVLVGAATHAAALRIDLRAWWGQVPRLAQGLVYGVVVLLVGLCSAQTQRFIYFAF
jgi:hypothetical protein